MRSHWAKYLCVLVAGFLENAIQELYAHFVRSAASEPVQNYAISRLSAIRNPKMSRFIEVAGAFKRSWAKELEEFAESSGRKDAIDSIMRNRHQIAHGQYSGVTMVRLKDYLDKALEVVEFIERQCDT